MWKQVAQTLVISTAIIAPGYAAEPADPLVEIPREYIRPAPSFPPAAPDRESPQALNGNNYTILAPVFDGSDGNTSYVRFRNSNNDIPVVVTVTFVGNVTGHVYGSALVTVPAHASPQYSFHQIRDAAQVSGYIGADDGFSLYLRSSQDGTDYQHVTYNAESKFFENLSVCYWDDGFSYEGMAQWLGNVHTTSSYMTEYPSAIMLHHYGATSALYGAKVFRSTDGAYLGGFTFSMAANETFAAPTSWYENAIKWTPADVESHINIWFYRADGFTYTGLVAHGIYNARLNAYINMTQFCGVNKQF